VKVSAGIGKVRDDDGVGAVVKAIEVQCASTDGGHELKIRWEVVA